MSFFVFLLPPFAPAKTAGACFRLCPWCFLPITSPMELGSCPVSVTGRLRRVNRKRQNRSSRKSAARPLRTPLRPSLRRQASEQLDHRGDLRQALRLVLSFALNVQRS